MEATFIIAILLSGEKCSVFKVRNSSFRNKFLSLINKSSYDIERRRIYSSGTFPFFKKKKHFWNDYVVQGTQIKIKAPKALK